MSDQNNPDLQPLQHLALRVEEASLNAWPALHQQLYEGWLLRFSRGFTKRANSVNPLYQGLTRATGQPWHKGIELVEKIRYCENLYAREDQPTVFRLTSLAGQESLEQALADRGYERGGLSLVLITELGSPEPPLNPDLATEMLPALDDWLDGYCQIAQLPPLARTLHQAILRGIHGQLALARQSSGAATACGLGVLEAELLGLFDIITAPAARRQGHARALVQDLMYWGQQNQARYSYLQVAADNAPALALYAQLGFTELYRYWYRSSR
ncbi:MAG: GNAT family N-acetyltransferase [Pseudomonadales bacterium]